MIISNEIKTTIAGDNIDSPMGWLIGETCLLSNNRIYVAQIWRLYIKLCVYCIELVYI